MIINTIGYEGLDIDEFLSIIAENDIDTVVDVRELPLSRKPGFSKKALASVLNLSGREYIHMVDLGCPKHVRNRYREDGNWDQYIVGFMKYLKTQEAAIAELSNLVGSSNCVLLCYEADYNFCHRSIVANAVRQYCGVDIKHIKVDKTKTANLASPRLAFS
ncbi:DUF488 domain-containing protein [Nitrosomonas sp.]|uniref:DUF488 domain-containing protein n=1 Tax=Nitrosomonas sp. TaxID=42353 RepID=UPI00260F8D71|nr:DUF488 domain-containing protein [Nitrosomonas sp.]MCW5600437.1 DUF488 domain-containing protein [Nitrosomonas sp.]